MKTKELIEYLQTFDGDTEVGFIITNTEARIKYNSKAYQFVKDEDIDFPVVIIDTDGIVPFSEIAEECKE